MTFFASRVREPVRALHALKNVLSRRSFSHSRFPSLSMRNDLPAFFLLFYVTVFFFGFESFSLFSESFLDFTGLFIRLEEEKLVSLFGLFEFSI